MTNKTHGYLIVLFDSTSAALLAERLLNRKSIAYKIIPVPRRLSSDCGVCLRILEEDRLAVEEAFKGAVDVQAICCLESKITSDIG
ncbi:MAG: DUF3343 domain-containing protein [Deltaproteobacteria bacterium]|nr:DUF3343 domain-containing protein [Deltaproteobacteria bacterium]